MTVHVHLENQTVPPYLSFLEQLKAKIIFTEELLQHFICFLTPFWKDAQLAMETPPSDAFALVGPNEIFVAHQYWTKITHPLLFSETTPESGYSRCKIKDGDLQSSKPS